MRIINNISVDINVDLIMKLTDQYLNNIKYKKY